MLWMGVNPGRAVLSRANVVSVLWTVESCYGFCLQVRVVDDDERRSSRVTKSKTCGKSRVKQQSGDHYM